MTTIADQPHRPSRDTHTILNTIFTGVLVLFTIILAYIGCQANQNNIVSQRAFVNSRGAQTIGFVTDDKGTSNISLRIGALWENSGATPAIAVHARINPLSMSATISNGFDFADTSTDSITPFVIGPKALQTVGPVPLTIDDLESARLGHTHLYVHGWATYSDAFTTERHLTEFCQELVNIRPGIAHMIQLAPGAVIIELIGCRTGPNHNCYDRDCIDYKNRIQQ